jgi:hypothetical protein
MAKNLDFLLRKMGSYFRAIGKKRIMILDGLQMTRTDYSWMKRKQMNSKQSTTNSPADSLLHLSFHSLSFLPPPPSKAPSPV